METMAQLRQVSRLRLIVFAPEVEIAGVKPGARIDFTLPAFPGETFSGASMNQRGLTSWKYSAILSPEIRSPFAKPMSCERT